MTKFALLFSALVALLVNTLVAQSTYAQDAKPAAAPAATTPATAPTTTPTAAAKTETASSIAVPKHNCKQPTAPGSLGSDTQQKNFVKEVDAYRDCLIAFRNDMTILAKASVDAGNAAVEEFNAYAASLNKK